MLSPKMKEMRSRKALDSPKSAFMAYNEDSNPTQSIRQHLKHKSSLSNVTYCKGVSGTERRSWSNSSTQRQLNNVTASGLFLSRRWNSVFLPWHRQYQNAVFPKIKKKKVKKESKLERWLRGLSCACFLLFKISFLLYYYWSKTYTEEQK